MDDNTFRLLDCPLLNKKYSSTMQAEHQTQLKDFKL